MSNIGNTTSEAMISFGAKSGPTCAAMVSLPITRCRDFSKVIPIWISRRWRELQQAKVVFCVRLELFVGIESRGSLITLLKKTEVVTLGSFDSVFGAMTADLN